MIYFLFQTYKSFYQVINCLHLIYMSMLTIFSLLIYLVICFLILPYSAFCLQSSLLYTFLFYPYIYFCKSIPNLYLYFSFNSFECIRKDLSNQDNYNFSRLKKINIRNFIFLHMGEKFHAFGKLMTMRSGPHVKACWAAG